MKRIHLVREYPTVNGFPVHPYELELPPSRFNDNKPYEFNNHHIWFTARKMGELVLTQTCRDLDENQLVLPKDVHAVLHDRYEAPRKVPEIYDLMNYVDDAYQAGKLLRYGSASNPTYKTITPELRARCLAEYEQIA